MVFVPTPPSNEHATMDGEPPEIYTAAEYCVEADELPLIYNPFNSGLPALMTIGAAGLDDEPVDPIASFIRVLLV